MFNISLVFGVVYLILYPGLGNFAGVLGWTQTGQHIEEEAKAKETYAPLFAKYANISIEELSHVKQATQMGKRIFVNTCSGCHGSDARGNTGYPNLTDRNWLYGGSVANIEYSINYGRKGIMPGYDSSLNAEQIDGLVQYVGKIAGHSVNESKASIGKTIFDQQCFGCHGADAKGNIAMGAPNLTDNIWLYGGSATNIAKSIKKGRQGEMPAHLDLLGKERSHLVTAYIYSLSN